MKPRIVGIAFALVAIIALAYSVWPTPYRIERVDNELIRIHRWTGAPEALTATGWIRLAPNPFSDLGTPAPPTMDTGMTMDTSTRDTTP